VRANVGKFVDEKKKNEGKKWKFEGKIVNCHIYSPLYCLEKMQMV
jgi:hypothetical protein